MSHQINIFDQNGSLRAIVVDAIDIRWSRTINNVDSLAFQIAPGHHATEYCRRWHRAELLRDNVVEFSGNIMEVDGETERPLAVVADGYAAQLDYMALAWQPDLANRTTWPAGTYITQIVEDLVNYNLGDLATVVNGRYANGVRTNPRWARPAAVGTATLAWEASGTSTIWGELSRLAQATQSAFLVEPNTDKHALLSWRPRPYGIVRPLVLRDGPTGNLTRLRLRVDHRRVASRAIVRLSNIANTGTETVLGTVVDRVGVPQSQLVETIATLQNSPTDRIAQGKMMLAESQSGLYGIELELGEHLKRGYRTSWDIGDRFKVATREGLLTVDIEGIVFAVDEGGAEHVDVEVLTYYGGYYA